LDHINALSPSAIRKQVDRLRRNPLFAGSDRLMAFLTFVVEETLQNSSASLKEAVIGSAIYEREPPYDPRIDSTVRVEARRLRRKLEEYYAGDGRLDSIRISLPTGGYVPTFKTNIAEDEQSRALVTNKGADGDNIFTEGPGAAIAIMPLRALSRDPDDEPFADGLTDELIFTLGRAQGLRITPRVIAFQYKERSYSLAALASELGVDVVIQGVVRREGDVIRVTVEASDLKGYIIWSDRFDALDQERLRLQERIATTILSRLRFDSSRMRAMQISPSAIAVDAHAKIYRARRLLDQQTPAALKEALDLFHQVSRSAPDYAPGHSGIADCHCDLFRLGLIDCSTALSMARPAVRRALEIDPRSIEAHTATATISAWIERDWAKAEADFTRASELGENARTARIHGIILTFLNRHEEAERLFREARAIEPFSVQQDIAEAMSHYQARRYSLLVDAKPEVKGQRPPAESLFYTALAHIFAGSQAGARALIAEIEHARTSQPDLTFAQAEIEAWLGEPERGRRQLADHGNEATCFGRATLAAALNDEQRCLDELEAAVDRREFSTVWLRTEARFDRLLGSQRFRRLLERLCAT